MVQDGTVLAASGGSIVTLLMVLIAHFGVRLTLYNRLNGWGLERVLTKRLEKLLVLESFVTPVLITFFLWRPLNSFLHGETAWESLPLAFRSMSYVLFLGASIFGALWLLWRPIWKVQHAQVIRRTRVEKVDQIINVPLALTQRCLALDRIPINQMFDLSIDEIELTVPGLPDALDGYRIAHLSDVHLTGQVAPDFTRRVLEHVADWQPDLVALTGDIVDVESCLDWIPNLFGPITAPDGCWFILGNHDVRVHNPDHVRERMTDSGWNDLGGRMELKTIRGVDINLVGNEYPWFGRPTDEQMENRPADFCLTLSHSPDQFDWGRKHGVQLMLAGHTHGGQGRLPLAGPLISPSMHGTRWASGDFYRAPTTLHVSRGLSSVQLLRINCRPELSLLTLRTNA